MALSVYLSGRRGTLGRHLTVVVSSFTREPEDPTVDDAIVLTAVVSNLGTGDAGPSQVAVKVGGEAFPPRYDVPVLAPGASHSVTRTITLLVPQTYGAIATADPDDTLLESDEDNNTAEQIFTVWEPLRLRLGSRLTNGRHSLKIETIPGCLHQLLSVERVGEDKWLESPYATSYDGKMVIGPLYSGLERTKIIYVARSSQTQFFRVIRTPD